MYSLLPVLTSPTRCPQRPESQRGNLESRSQGAVIIVPWDRAAAAAAARPRLATDCTAGDSNTLRPCRALAVAAAEEGWGRTVAKRAREGNPTGWYALLLLLLLLAGVREDQATGGGASTGRELQKMRHRFESATLCMCVCACVCE